MSSRGRSDANLESVTASSRHRHARRAQKREAAWRGEFLERGCALVVLWRRKRVAVPAEHHGPLVDRRIVIPKRTRRLIDGQFDDDDVARLRGEPPVHLARRDGRHRNHAELSKAAARPSPARRGAWQGPIALGAIASLMTPNPPARSHHPVHRLKRLAIRMLLVAGIR
jgi:hypothetical protein